MTPYHSVGFSVLVALVLAIGASMSLRVSEKYSRRFWLIAFAFACGLTTAVGALSRAFFAARMILYATAGLAVLTSVGHAARAEWPRKGVDPIARYAAALLGWCFAGTVALLALATGNGLNRGGSYVGVVCTVLFGVILMVAEYGSSRAGARATATQLARPVVAGCLSMAWVLALIALPLIISLPRSCSGGHSFVRSDNAR